MRFKKSVLSGFLAVSTLVGASAVSAASPGESANNTGSHTIYKQYTFDLGSLLQQQQTQQGNSSFDWSSLLNKLPGYTSNSGQASSGNETNSNNGAAPGWTIPDWNIGTNQGGTGSSGSGNGAGTENGSQATTGNEGSQASTGSDQGTVNDSSSAYASQVVDLVNQERAKAGLNALTSDSALAKMALDKAKDMYNNNYFDHNSPTYGSPFDMMRTYGISYSYAGENIAKGQRTPQDVMTAWMNSSGHRANILNANFTKIGVAYYNGEWVQEFIAN
ncbi:CAP domain-containing protein [Paenibacillus sp. y28]|uniref:CAP domain-containing protein n=1 Tax=Paenibacillus sp. y28 TaxID=3129110 RepID=UPI00301678FC